MAIPKVVFAEQAYDFMAACIAQVDAEVGGVGYAVLREDGSIYVEEAFLMDQVVSSGGVDFTPDAVAKAQERAAVDGKIERLRFSWHSHYNFGVFWSNTDEGGISDYLNFGGCDWLLSFVMNKRGEYKARLDVQGTPVVGRVKWDELDVEVERAPNPQREAAKAAIAEHVTMWTYTPKKGYGGKGNGKVNVVKFDDKRKKTAAEKVRDLMHGEEDDSTLIGAAAFGFYDPLYDDENVGLHADRNGRVMDVTPREAKMLREAGHDPDAMNEDQLLDALIECTLGDGQGA